MRTRVAGLLVVVSAAVAACTSSGHPHASPSARQATAAPEPTPGVTHTPPAARRDDVAGKGAKVGLLLPAAGAADVPFLLRGCTAQNLICVVRRTGPARMTAAAQELIATGVRVLVMVDATSPQAGAIERAAYADGVQSVDDGRLVPGGAATVFVAPGVADARSVQARGVAHCPFVPKAAGYVRLGPAGVAAVRTYARAVPRRWRLVAARPGTSVTAARAVLAAAPRARAVLATNDAAAAAAVAAARSRGRAGRLAVAGLGLSPGALQRILVRTQCLTVAPSASAQAAATLAAVVRLVNFQRVSGSRVVRRPGGRSTVVVAVHGARLVRFPDVRSVIAAGAVPRAAVCTPAYQAACTQAGI